MKKYLLAIVLFILGACSTIEDKNNNNSISSLENVLARFQADAQRQLGSVNNMTRYVNTIAETRTIDNFSQFNLEILRQQIFYFNASKTSFKATIGIIQNGSDKGVTYHSEASIGTAQEGTLTVTDAKNIQDATGKDLTDLKGFTKLYKFTSANAKIWNFAQKTWENNPSPFEQPLIVKEEGDKLYTILVNPVSGVADTYRINSLEINEFDAIPYQKSN